MKALYQNNGTEFFLLRLFVGGVLGYGLLYLS